MHDTYLQEGSQLALSVSLAIGAGVHSVQLMCHNRIIKPFESHQITPDTHPAEGMYEEQIEPVPSPGFLRGITKYFRWSRVNRKETLDELWDVRMCEGFC